MLYVVPAIELMILQTLFDIHISVFWCGYAIKMLPQLMLSAPDLKWTRRNFLKNTTRASVRVGVLQTGVVSFTWIAIVLGASPVAIALAHFGIHAQRLFVRRRKSVVQWYGALLALVGVLYLVLLSLDIDGVDNGNIRIQQSNVPMPTQPNALVHLADIASNIPMGRLLPVIAIGAAHLCEILLSDEDVEILTARTPVLQFTGSILHAGFVLLNFNQFFEGILIASFDNVVLLALLAFIALFKDQVIDEWRETSDYTQTIIAMQISRCFMIVAFWTVTWPQRIVATSLLLIGTMMFEFGVLADVRRATRPKILRRSETPSAVSSTQQ